MFWRLLVRDLAVAVVVATGWRLGAHLSTGSGPIADLVGVVLGIGAGVVAYLAHEWGHLLGALATGSAVRAPAGLASAFLFSFDRIVMQIPCQKTGPGISGQCREGLREWRKPPRMGHFHQNPGHRPQSLDGHPVMQINVPGRA